MQADHALLALLPLWTGVGPITRLAGFLLVEPLHGEAEMRRNAFVKVTLPIGVLIDVFGVLYIPFG